jgi:hypothetical protein
MDQRKRKEMEAAKHRELTAERDRLQSWQDQIESPGTSASTHHVRLPASAGHSAVAWFDICDGCVISCMRLLLKLMTRTPIWTRPHALSAF